MVTAGAGATVVAVVSDLLPIMLVLAVFQGLALRQRLRRPAQVAVGLALLVPGLVMVLHGLEHTVFPLGQEVARALALAVAPAEARTGAALRLFLFVAALGFAAALAEPVLAAVAHRASQLSGGAIQPWGLRVAVAIGIGLGACLGLLRVILGLPLFPLLAVLLAVLYLQARATPRLVVNLALDAGVLTISTVTAPLLVAVGIGVAAELGASMATEGFGLLAVTAMGPAWTVMGYGQLAARRARS